MCGRYGQTEKGIENFANTRQLPLKGDFSFENNYNLSPFNQTVFLRNGSEKNLIFDRGLFAYKPFPGKFSVINIRAEGKQLNEEESENQGKKVYDQLNAENSSEYSGVYNIGNNGYASRGFKQFRCIIPVDYFFEGPQKEALSKPYLIKRKDSEPFALASICSFIKEDNAWYAGIVTTAAADLLKKVGHHRSPFVLTKDQESIWMDHSISHNEVAKLFAPFNSSEFHAYPVSPEMKAPNRKDKPNNSPELINPINNEVLV